jgi:hypothetical protein
MDLRKSVEHLSRGLVFKRRLPPEFHHFPIDVSPEPGLRYWSRMSKVDPMLYRMARELVKPSASVWDDIWLAHLLTKSARELELRRLNAAPVNVLCAAVSDGNRITHLQISKRSRAGESSGRCSRIQPGGRKPLFTSSNLRVARFSVGLFSSATRFED